MKVLISGGGIAGTALAFWLSSLGYEVTVIERFASLRTTSLQIDLRGHGIEVLRRMGLEQGFRANSAPEQGWQLVDSSGRRRAYFPANTTGKGLQNFTSEFEIMRGDLVRLFHDASQDKVKYEFDRTVERFEETDSAVEVVFSDGTTKSFDLLVGADGQWSRTRRMTLGADTPDALHRIPDTYIGYFTTPQPIKPNEEYLATMFLSPGRRGVMVRRHSPTAIQVYMACTNKSSMTLQGAQRGDITAEKRGLAEVFRGAGWRVDELVTAMHTADGFYCERLGLVDLPSWSSPGGRVVLVGDAAYSPTANTGMGTTSAVVGAYILAGEIGRSCGGVTKESDGDRKTTTGEDLAAALKAYEDTFRPFMTQVQKGVLEDKGFMPETALGVALFNFFVGVASFFRWNISGWALKEKINKDWCLPDYEEMVRTVA